MVFQTGFVAKKLGLIENSLLCGIQVDSSSRTGCRIQRYIGGLERQSDLTAIDEERAPIRA